LNRRMPKRKDKLLYLSEIYNIFDEVLCFDRYKNSYLESQSNTARLKKMRNNFHIYVNCMPQLV